MPDADLRPMDLAVLRCLRQFRSAVASAELEPCLAEMFPGSDEVTMRQGESITRLRGRNYLLLREDGRLELTSEGREAAEHMPDSWLSDKGPQPSS